MYDEQATFGAILLFIAGATFLGMFCFSFFGKKKNLLLGESLSDDLEGGESGEGKSQSFVRGVKFSMGERVKVLNFVDLFALLGFFGMVALLWWGRGMKPSEEPQKVTETVLFSAMMMQVFFASVPIMIISFRAQVADFFGLRWRGWAHVGWLAVVACVTTYILFFFVDLLGYKQFMEDLFGGDMEQETVKFLKDPETSMRAFWLMALVAVVFAPLGEEFLFRGYIYPVMRRFGHPVFAIFFSGLLFSFFHFNMYALLPLFLFGMVLAYLYEVTGSIWAPMVAHGLFNGVSVVMSYAIKTGKLPGLEI